MKRRGTGIATTIYGTGYGNGFPDVSRAICQLDSRGVFQVFTGATDVGQGVKTTLVQIAAETLGVSSSRVELIADDTDLVPDAGTAAASRQTYNNGNAVKAACQQLRERIIELAQHVLGLNSPAGLVIDDDKVVLTNYPDKWIGLQGIQSSSDLPLREEGEFTAQTVKMDDDTGQGAPYWPYTFTAYGVELYVDTETGEVDITRAICAQDTGRTINPDMAEGQLDGGFAMGVGFALMEELELKQGKIANGSLEKYLIPTALDIPEVEKVLIEDPEPTAPYGAKGIGEPVLLPVAPAVLNAIYDAVGIRITDPPATPDKILSYLKQLNS